MLETILLSSATAGVAGLLGLAAFGRMRRLQEDATLARPGLLARMVARQGVDPEVLGRPGVLASTDDAIQKCRACAHETRCRSWLGADASAYAPKFCPNADYLKSLRSPQACP